MPETTEFTPEQIEEWKEEVEETGDPNTDVYFHQDDEAEGDSDE